MSEFRAPPLTDKLPRRFPDSAASGAANSEFSRKQVPKKGNPGLEHGIKREKEKNRLQLTSMHEEIPGKEIFNNPHRLYR